MNKPGKPREMKRSDQISEHLAFFTELGVGGVSCDPRWRVRPADGVTILTPASTASGIPELEREPTTVETLAGDAVGVSMFDHLSVAEDGTAAERLQIIRQELGDCTRCRLHTKRTTLVYGVGNADADLMFVGEAPGRDEDLQGIPFVGRAGQLLTKIIESIGLRRDDVYIANVIKCRPPDNRNPAPDEVRTCEPFLFAQIDAIRPRVIVALGSFAARTLLRTEDAISKMRGRVYAYRGAQLIPTFHPAFLLRSPDRKRDVWEDMKKVRAILRER